MAENPSRPAGDRSMVAQATELWDLVRGYVVQETVGPIKGAGRFVAFGLAGSLLLGVGVILLALGLLRFLQTETGDALDGNWSFVPYLAVLAVCGAVVALALSRIGRKERTR